MIVQKPGIACPTSSSPLARRVRGLCPTKAGSQAPPQTKEQTPEDSAAPQYRVTKRLQSTQEERDAKPPSILDTAEHQLAGFCSAIPGDQDSEGCWEAYHYLGKQRADAEAGCEVEFADSHALTGEQCERLENFESFVRQSVGEAHMERFVQTLQALSHAEKRRLAKELEMHAKDEPADAEVKQAAAMVKAAGNADVRKSRLVELFYSCDTNNDGKLNVAEFRDAMRSLGDELSARTVQIIFESMVNTRAAHLLLQALKITGGTPEQL
eukprot:jgi/Astpho2/9743/fgenesh1_pg.00149_%23_28_t